VLSTSYVLGRKEEVEAVTGGIVEELEVAVGKWKVVLELVPLVVKSISIVLGFDDVDEEEEDDDDKE